MARSLCLKGIFQNNPLNKLAASVVELASRMQGSCYREFQSICVRLFRKQSLYSTAFQFQLLRFLMFIFIDIFFLAGKMCDFYRSGRRLWYLLPKCQGNSEFSTRGTKTTCLVKTTWSFCTNTGSGNRDSHVDFFPSAICVWCFKCKSAATL